MGFEPIKYTIHGINRVVDEKGNSFIALRELSWGDNETVKLDIRKYYTGNDGKETLAKGVSFLTDDGPGELVKALIEEGYGDTREIFESLATRDEFAQNCIWGLNTTLSGEALEQFRSNPEEYIKSNAGENDGEFYDPRDILGFEEVV